MNGHVFYGVSDYMLADPNGFLFNKDMLRDFELENPYDLVRSDDWTLEKMMSMASVVMSDLDGDGDYDENDRYGYSVNDDWRSNSFIYSSGLRLERSYVCTGHGWKGRDGRKGD